MEKQGANVTPGLIKSYIPHPRSKQIAILSQQIAASYYLMGSPRKTVLFPKNNAGLNL